MFVGSAGRVTMTTARQQRKPQPSIVSFATAKQAYVQKRSRTHNVCFPRAGPSNTVQRTLRVGGWVWFRSTQTGRANWFVGNVVRVITDGL